MLTPIASVVIASEFCSLNSRIHAKKWPNTTNRDVSHVNMIMTSQRRFELTCYSTMDPSDCSSLWSGFVLGTAVKYWISFISRVYKRCYYTRLVYNIFTQRTYSYMQDVFLFLKVNLSHLCRSFKSTDTSRILMNTASIWFPSTTIFSPWRWSHLLRFAASLLSFL